MSFSRFIWKNTFRNKRRTGLTILSIGFSLFLLMTLLTFMDTLLNPVIEDDSALRLMVTRSTSIADMLPISYLDKIRRVPGVAHAAPLQWFNGVYRDPDYQFANFGTDPAEIFKVYTEQILPPDEQAAFIADRRGAVAGADLARRFGWKVGDKVTLTGTIFPVDLDLNIVGIFTADLNQNMFYFRWDYLDEALGKPGMAGAYTVKATDPASVPMVVEAIDGMFRNSPAETKTTTEKAFVLGFISMLGNIQMIIGSIAGVVVFTMLLVAVSTMAMTVRERMREVAILKAVGYSRNLVMSLVMAEALFISLVGAGLGLGLGQSLRLIDLDRMTQGFIQRYDPGLSTCAAVVGAGVVIGLVSGFIPARQAAGMSITTAMRRME
jgi:putative ABC transport system permease protein